MKWRKGGILAAACLVVGSGLMAFAPAASAAPGPAGRGAGTTNGAGDLVASPEFAALPSGSTTGLTGYVSFAVAPVIHGTVRCVTKVSGFRRVVGCGMVTIALPSYSVTISGTVTLKLRGAAPTMASFTMSTGQKALVADASGAFGVCPTGGIYCGSNSHSCATTAFATGQCPNLVFGGTSLWADCWTTGSTVRTGTGNQSTVWIHVPSYGPFPWMSNMYFSNWTHAADNLPHC